MTPILSNYQEGLRNAKVYKTTNGNFGVVVYDANDDFNAFESFEEIHAAETYAQNWVARSLA